MTVFVSDKSDESRSTLLDPSVLSWSETEFEPPEAPVAELLELRNRRAHALDTVQPSTSRESKIIFVHGMSGGSSDYGEVAASIAHVHGHWTSIKPSAPIIVVAHSMGGRIVSALTRNESDGGKDVIALELESKRWDVSRWGDLFGSFLATTLSGITGTASSIATLRWLLRRQARDERIRKLPPDRRALYERIKSLREDIGPGEFDINQAIRELRESA